MNQSSHILSLVVMALIFTTGCILQASAKPPIELGRVSWQRDLPSALNQSKESDKPVFLLFQEVPGCATCSVYGRQILSHPLIVEAIEDLFIPVLIYNNRPGTDSKILKTYNEPAWNNPVVRYLDADGRDIIPRRTGVWTVDGTVRQMVQALKAKGRNVPAYLKLLKYDNFEVKTEKATFGMYCFWTGEMRLGNLKGVLNTRAGWVGANEVVEVLYDPEIISFEKLTMEARATNCATTIYTHTNGQKKIVQQIEGQAMKALDSGARNARPSDQKYALKQTPYRYLPLTPYQLTKVNGAVGAGKFPRRWLSPRQKKLLSKIQAALSKAPNALKDLPSPEKTDDLAQYQDILKKRLRDLGFSKILNP